jgi:predicted transcriptional regulator
MTETQKLDYQILGYLSQLSNKKKKAVLTVVKTFAEDDETQYWNDLPEDIKFSIETGLKQADAGVGLPHETVMKKYKKWLNK